MLAILDIKQNRRAVTKSAMILALVVLFVVAAPVAMLRAQIDPPAAAQPNAAATLPSVNRQAVVDQIPDVVGCRLRTRIHTTLLPIASNSVTAIGSASLFEQTIPAVDWITDSGVPVGVTHFSVVVFPISDPDISKVGEAEIWRRLKSPEHPAWTIDRPVGAGGIEYNFFSEAASKIKADFQPLITGTYAFYVLGYKSSPVTGQERQPVAFAGVVLEIKPLPFTQIADDEIQLGGTIYFRSINQSTNNSARTWKQGGFMNSPFVQVSSMVDDQNRPIDFSSENQGNHIQYRYTLNDPVQSGQASIYEMEGTESGLVQKLPGKSEYQYKMTHAPSAGQPVHRVEFYQLPRFAELIETVSVGLPQRMREDGRIEILHEEMIPTDGNITTLIHYRVPSAADQPLGNIKQLVHDAVTAISTRAEGDPNVIRALKSLEGLDETRAVVETARYFSSDQDDIRRAAIYVLWRSDFKSIDAAKEPLIKLCKHPEDLTRGMAALALGGKRVSGSEPILVQMLSDDKSAYARRCAAYAIGLLGDINAFPAIRKATTDPDPGVVANAHAAIQMMTGPRD